MMKYIRVKDDCYEWITTFAEYDEARNKATELGLTYSRKIIKQADTIEDLCDCFVTVGKKHYVWDKQHFPTVTLEQMQSYPISDFEIYGAIWTGKGLIYVAKMNDKGELELL